MRVKIVLTVILVVIMLFSSGAIVLSQELPEPTAPPIGYAYEIAWGSKLPSLTWAAITPVSSTVVSGTAATVHKYSGVIGNNTFEFTAVDSTVATPKVVVVVVNVPSIPGSNFYNIFRLHVAAAATIDNVVNTGPWSDASYWVMIIDWKKLSLPVSK